MSSLYLLYSFSDFYAFRIVINMLGLFGTVHVCNNCCGSLTRWDWHLSARFGTHGFALSCMDKRPQESPETNPIKSWLLETRSSKTKPVRKSLVMEGRTRPYQVKSKRWTMMNCLFNLRSFVQFTVVFWSVLICVRSSTNCRSPRMVVSGSTSSSAFSPFNDRMVIRMARTVHLA